MDFASAVTIINKLLVQKQPHVFNSSWIRENAPHTYRFFQKNIRTETDCIDWDRITRALDRKFQRRWIQCSRKRIQLYRDKAEAQMILQKYDDKLYTFLTPEDKTDNDIRDTISIALVRIAQQGNAIAQEIIIDLVRLTIDDWIERCPVIARWKGYDQLIQKRIEGCIRCYRYSGSFIGYLFRTLQYAGKGIRPIIAYSLDDSLFSGEKRKCDRIARDPENGKIRIYGKI